MERFHDYRQHIRKPGMLTPWHKKQIVQNYVVKIWKKVHTKAGDIHVWLSLARLLIYNCCVVFMIYWDLTFLYHFSLYKGLFSGKITCLRTKDKFTDLDFLCAIIIYQTYLPQSFCYDFCSTRQSYLSHDKRCVCYSPRNRADKLLWCMSQCVKNNIYGD